MEYNKHEFSYAIKKKKGDKLISLLSKTSTSSIMIDRTDLLVYAVQYGNVEIVMILLERGYGLRPANFAVAFKRAVLKKNVDIILALITFAETACVGSMWQYHSKTIIELKLYSVISHLVSMGHSSLFAEYPEILLFIEKYQKSKGLFEKMARKIKNNLMALHSYDDVSMFQLAYSLGGDVRKSMKTLVSLGYDITSFDRTKSYCEGPILFELIRHGEYAIVVTALELGAEVTMYNYDGETPLYHALRFRQKEIAQLLIYHGASIKDFSSHLDSPLAPYLVEEDRDMIEYLFSIGVSITYETSLEKTLLTYIFEEGLYQNQAGVIRYLTLLEEYGYDFSQYSSAKSGISILHRLVADRKKSIAQFFLQRNFSVDIPDSLGKSVVHYAADLTNKKDIPFLRKIVAKSALFTQENSVSPKDFMAMVTWLYSGADTSSSNVSTSQQYLETILDTTPLVLKQLARFYTIFVEEDMERILQKFYRYGGYFLRRVDDYTTLASMATSPYEIDWIVNESRINPFELLHHVAHDDMKAYLFTKTVGGTHE